MRISLAAAALLAVAFAGEARATERIYVLSQAGAMLSAFDERASEPAFSIGLDKAPAALAFGAKGGLAYVTHPDLGTVSAVDVVARRVVRSIPVEGSPFGIATAKDGRLYVGDWNGAHVSVLDPGGHAPVHRIAVGRAPAHVLLVPDERLAVVANRESDSVSVIRTADLTVAATIKVGRAPFAMALSPDAARLYVGNVQDGTVSVIDMGTFKVIQTLASGAMPYGAAVTPDGARLLITNQQASTVAVLAGNDPAPARIKVGGYPEGIAVNGRGTRAYVANWFSDDVSELDLSSLSEIRRIKCPAGPRGVAIWNGAP